LENTEELTLYLIELNKKVAQLTKEKNELKAKIEVLEKNEK